MKLTHLVMIFCLSFLQAGTSFAQGDICKGLFLSENEMLVKIYERYVKERNEGVENLPSTVSFKGRSYKVLELLGGGIEGIVVRVEDSNGKKSIMKIFMALKRNIFLQIWDYRKMNKHNVHTYAIVAVDYKNKIFQFDDMRGIPMRRIGNRLTEAGASEAIAHKIFKKVALEGYTYYDQNTLYDIDRHVFVAIDPH